MTFLQPSFSGAALILAGADHLLNRMRHRSQPRMRFVISATQFEPRVAAVLILLFRVHCGSAITGFVSEPASGWRLAGLGAFSSAGCDCHAVRPLEASMDHKVLEQPAQNANKLKLLSRPLRSLSTPVT
jgi:hypothetical protein